HGHRHPPQPKDPVGTAPTHAIEFDRIRSSRPGARRKYDAIRTHGDVLPVVHREGVRIDEGRDAAQQLDTIAQQLGPYDLDLAPDDVLSAGGQVGDGDVALDSVAGPVQITLGHPGQVEHSLAHRLGRDGAGVDADSTYHVPAVYHRCPATQLGRRNRRPLAARAAADYQQVVVLLLSSQESGVADSHWLEQPPPEPLG